MNQGTIVHDDGRTDAERAYDALKDGSAYTKAAAGVCPACAERTAPGAASCDVCGAPVAPAPPSALLLAVADFVDEDDECPACTPKCDCPACTAKYEATRQQILASAAAAPTMVERVELLMEGGELPNGDQLFDLMLEDRIAHYVWLRAIDWVLWRQAHGKPVKVLAQPDHDSAAIDARYDAARALAADITNYRPDSTEADVHLLCAGEMIARWERTPAEDAALAEDTDLMIKILEAIDGGE